MLTVVVVFVFFFSSRRRHTRSDRDWSSDVCSSDLPARRRSRTRPRRGGHPPPDAVLRHGHHEGRVRLLRRAGAVAQGGHPRGTGQGLGRADGYLLPRSGMDPHPARDARRAPALQVRPGLHELGRDPGGPAVGGGGTTERAGRETMSFEAAKQVADALLFEGYVLYPYRASAATNQGRWQFGVLAPKEWAASGGEHAEQQTQCLLEADDDAVVERRLRFLQVQAKL